MNPDERRGMALIICAPSGTGKTTLIKKLLAEFPRFVFSISCTTRPPREGEVNGKDYNFISKEKFIELRDDDYFAEWAVVHDNYYGTPLKTTLETLENGRDILFDVDVQGARQIRASLKQMGRYVFILPPSREALEHRLRARCTDRPEVIERRLANAAKELPDAPMFDHIIINDDLDKAYDELRSAFVAATLAPICRPHFVPELLRQWKEAGK